MLVTNPTIFTSTDYILSFNQGRSNGSERKRRFHTHMIIYIYNHLYLHFMTKEIIPDNFFLKHYLHEKKTRKQYCNLTLFTCIRIYTPKILYISLNKYIFILTIIQHTLN